MVNKNTIVKAVQRLKPMEIVFNIPDMDEANTKVNTPSTITDTLFIIRYFFSSTFGFMDFLYISCENSVDAPNNRLQAVDTSAAQSAARVMPAATGFSDNIILGSANVALTSGKATLADIPISAHKNPMGIIHSPPIINPFFAVLESLAAKAICTGPCMDMT